MYFTNVGGSMLLHVLAGHPRLIAAIGIASAVAMLSSPLGPGGHLGTAAYATRLERAVAARARVSPTTYASAQASVNRLVATHDPRVPGMIAAALTECGTNCSDLGLQAVMRDRRLERAVLLMYALDQHAYTRSRPSQVGLSAKVR